MSDYQKKTGGYMQLIYALVAAKRRGPKSEVMITQDCAEEILFRYRNYKKDQKNEQKQRKKG